MLNYGLTAHAKMVLDEVRRDAYARALQSCIRPGDLVVEIGAGTGYFTVLACKLGARKVVAFECSDVIDIAREVASANGCADRIEFVQGLSTSTSLPERADVVFADLRGVLPHFESNIQSMLDAAQRFLKPGGSLIPAQDRIWIACAQGPLVHERMQDSAKAPGDLFVDMSPLARCVANEWSKVHFPASALVSAPAVLEHVSYADPGTFALDKKIELPVAQGGRAGGLLLWFETILAPGVGFGSGPADQQALYGQAFFPWPRTIELPSGTLVNVRMRARPHGGDYLWTWESAIDRPDGSSEHFHQSEFQSTPLSTTRLARIVKQS